MTRTIFAVTLSAFISSSAAEIIQRCFSNTTSFGTATAAYQVEGAYNEGKRQFSIWDKFCRDRKAQGLLCADVADDFYHRYTSDIDLMKADGYTNFRFSVSWSRLMNFNPTTKRMERNEYGVNFYTSLIQDLLANGISPAVTLYHWDLPLDLYNSMDPPGWQNADSIGHFKEYADLVFQSFGKHVKDWVTFNEINTFLMQGMYYGTMAPGIKLDNIYYPLVNILLAHAEAFELFKEYKAKSILRSDAEIGIAAAIGFAYAMDPAEKEDVEASAISMAFGTALYLQPLRDGTFPDAVVERAGNDLPQLTEEQKKKLAGSYTTIYVNYYTSSRTTPCDSPRSQVPCDKLPKGIDKQRGLYSDQIFEGSRIPSNPLCSWLVGYGPGFEQSLKYLHKFSSGTRLVISEFGWCGENTTNDDNQLWYYRTHLEFLWRAIHQSHVPVDIVFYWSLADNYEWGHYSPRFGLYKVDYPKEALITDSGYRPVPSDLQRTRKIAGEMTAALAKSNCFTVDTTELPPVIEVNY